MENFKNEKTNLVVGVFSDTTHPLFLQLDKALNKRLSASLEEKFLLLSKRLHQFIHLDKLKAKKFISLV